MSDYRNISIRNKRATYDFEILDTYIAGIVLTGTEIKSLRLGKASLTDCYCYFHNGELFVRGMNIAEYHWGTVSYCSTARSSSNCSVPCKIKD